MKQYTKWIESYKYLIISITRGILVFLLLKPHFVAFLFTGADLYCHLKLNNSYIKFQKRVAYCSFLKTLTRSLSSKNGIVKGILNMDIQKVQHVHLIDASFIKLKNTICETMDFKMATDTFVESASGGELNVIYLITMNSDNFKQHLKEVVYKYEKNILNRKTVYTKLQEKYTETLVLTSIGIVIIYLLGNGLDYNKTLYSIGYISMTLINALIAGIVIYD